MSKQRPTVEWIVAESEADWDRLCVSSIPDLSPHLDKRMGRNHSLWVVGTLLLLLAGVSGSWAHGEQNALPPTVDEIVTLQAAPGAMEADHRSLVDTVIGDEMTQDWRRQFNQEESKGHAGQANPPGSPSGIEIAKIETLGDRAVVSIITTAKHGAPSFRQTLFYQQTATGWLQTEPDDALWRPVRTLETPYFVYHFREHDGPAVIRVAAQIDALYKTMRANFGLTSISSPEKLVIAVSLTNLPGYMPSYLRTVGQVSVPSPVLYLAPIELTDAQILAQSIVLPLLDQVIEEVIEQHGIESPWQPLLNGLRLWQLWGMELPLAGWREDVVKWLYADLPTADTRQPPMLPDHYAEFCTAHKLWLVSPTELGIPLLCADLDWEYQYVSSWYFLDLPIHLNQINPPPPQYDQSEEIRDRGRTVALATLIEYAVTTYGPDRLPVLVAGLGQYDSWETLIPAVFGVSAEGFEAGWQAHLATHYDVSLETIMPK